MNWADALKAVIPIVVMSLAWLLGQVNSFSERLTKIEGQMPALITKEGVPTDSPISAERRALLKEQMMVRAAGEVITAVNAGVMVSKLLQISCGAARSDNQEVVEFDAEGLLAKCVQHEMDHLMGKVFVEYLSPLKRNRIKTKMLKAKRDTERA